MTERGEPSQAARKKKLVHPGATLSKQRHQDAREHIADPAGHPLTLDRRVLHGLLETMHNACSSRASAMIQSLPNTAARFAQDRT
jgi:hypothetical protein